MVIRMIKSLLGLQEKENIELEEMTEEELIRRLQRNREESNQIMNMLLERGYTRLDLFDIQIPSRHDEDFSKKSPFEVIRDNDQ